MNYSIVVSDEVSLIPKEAVVTVLKVLPQIILKRTAKSTETQVAIVDLQRNDIKYGIYKHEDRIACVGISCYNASLTERK